MSTLEKTTDKQYDQSGNREEPPEDIFKNLVGVLQDTGKTLEEYREERILEK